MSDPISENVSLRINDEVKGLIIDNTLNAIICIDRSGEIVLWNKVAEKMFDWRQEEILGKPVHQIIIPTRFHKAYQIEFQNYQDIASSSFLNKALEITFLDRKQCEFSAELTVKSIRQNGFELLCGFIRDISERKHALDAIQNANDRFDIIARATNDVIWDWNIVSDEVIWNENYFLLFGYDRATTPRDSQSWKSSIHPEDKKRIVEEVQLAFASRRQSWSGEYRFLKADGSSCFVFEHGIILYDHDDKPVRMLGAIMDISDRKIAEAKLLESENRLRTIIQIEPECIKLVGCTGELLEMNPAGLAMIEAESIEQVRGKSVLEFVKPHHRDAFTAAVKDVLKGNSRAMKFEITGLKGAHRWIETHMVPMRDPSGIITSLLGVSRDITEQKKSEESLRKAEEQFRNIFENTLEGIYQSTPEGKFITANTSMAKMFGFDSAPEMIALTKDIGAEMYVKPSDRVLMKELVQKQGQANGFELRVRKKNREMIWVRANIRAINDAHGNLQYYEGSMEDITERKIAEEKLKTQFEEIQKTNYELDRFVYSVSHDLRAPLSSVLGIINIAEMEPVSNTLKEYLAMIRSSVNKLDRFIKDILDYSRNARIDVRFELINFRELLTETQDNLRLIEGAENLKVNIEIDDKFPFYSDSARIAIILNNLFSNSVKYQDPSKRSSFLTIKIITAPEKAIITLTDNGIGIAREHVEKIFNMFYRASDLSKGSGLGLYIAKESIGKIGGTISVQSVYGKGTVFEIVIPNSKLS